MTCFKTVWTRIEFSVKAYSSSFELVLIQTQIPVGEAMRVRIEELQKNVEVIVQKLLVTIREF